MSKPLKVWICSSEDWQDEEDLVNEWLDDNHGKIRIEDFRFNRDADKYHICFLYQELD